MTPYDNTGALIICIGLVEGLSDELICDECWLPDYLKRKLS